MPSLRSEEEAGVRQPRGEEALVEEGIHEDKTHGVSENTTSEPFWWDRTAF